MKFKLTAFIVVFMLFISLIPTHGQLREFSSEALTKVPANSSRLDLKNGSNGQTFFSYLVGPLNVNEPRGENLTGKHIFKFAVLQTNGSLHTENVTDTPVYPYHYNFVIASNGSIYTSYVTQNYTLFFAKRLGINNWMSVPITTPSNWYAMSPYIALTASGSPRIVYSVIYNQNSKDYFNSQFNVQGYTSIHYAALLNGQWRHFDLLGNHIGGFYSKSRQLIDVYYPGMTIVNGTSYIAFTNKINLARQINIQFLMIPNNPTQFLNSTPETYKTVIFPDAYDYQSIGSTFTRPVIFPINKGVFIAGGSWFSGNTWATYLPDTSVKPETNSLTARDQWSSVKFDPSRDNREVRSMTGVHTSGNDIYLTWSIKDVFDSATGRFTFDISMAKYTNFQGDIKSYVLFPVTNSLNIEHTYPVVRENKVNNRIEIYSLKTNNTIHTLDKYSALAAVKIQGGAGLGLVYSILGFTLIGGLAIGGIRKIKKPKVERALLPHEINLKDFIEEH